MTIDRDTEIARVVSAHRGRSVTRQGITEARRNVGERWVELQLDIIAALHPTMTPVKARDKWERITLLRVEARK